MKDVAGKTAFITGGASGMGLAMARSFAGAGMKVAIADIEASALTAVAEEFAETNASVITLQVDVSDLASMSEGAAKTKEAFGNVHVLVNNAGIVTGGTFAEAEPNDWRWTMNVNLDGVYNGLNSFLQDMIDHGEGGHVVNTASLAGHLAVPRLGIYGASKFAVVGMSETLRIELAEHNIGVSVLCPGVVNTNIFTARRNRPASLPSSQEMEFTPAVQDEEQSDASDVLRNIIEPDVVGDMVLHAVQHDRFYIFTHPDFAPMVRMRTQEIEDSFAYWSDYCENLK
ncbi:MAG: SDR family NAD(P)-dependent oxidoreductase [Gammaproteobacteria bacterium]|nr:SDR family NAD(P)-dependent oxidoreductase [Gammaproteobacteria bacterium]